MYQNNNIYIIIYENDIILDPFGGTGTTSAIAKKLKRNYITIELSEEYYKVIKDRLNYKDNSVQVELFN